MAEHESVTIQNVEEGQPAEANEQAPQEVSIEQQPDAVDVSTTEEAATGEAEQVDLKIEEKPEGPTDFFSDENYSRIFDAIVANDMVVPEELYAEFEAAGYPRTVADRLIKAETLIAEQRVTDIVSSVGGAERAQAALQWAAENLSSEQIQTINAQLQGRDKDVAQLALQGLVAQAGGQTTVSADSGGGSGEMFMTEEDFQEAIRDDARMSSPGYRQMVMEKLDRSVRAGYIEL